ncbi:MAG: peptidase [Gammaproteobacteria bacterium]
MTYCVATLLDTGLVFLSDSRTNAGVDQINTFRKVTVFEQPGERVIVLQTAGNLAVSQAVVNHLQEAIADPSGPPSLANARTMFEAAQRVGDAVRTVHARDADAFKEFGIDFNAAILMGGQIAGELPRLFSIYAAGNFIEATPDTTYFQIGESKYGRPILDRVIRRSSSLNEAIKCALVSMDSTIRSNLSVGLPLDLVVIRRDALRVARHLSIGEDHEYFRGIRNSWGESLRLAFTHLPDPDWTGRGSAGADS